MEHLMTTQGWFLFRGILIWTNAKMKKWRNLFILDAKNKPKQKKKKKKKKKTISEVKNFIL